MSLTSLFDLCLQYVARNISLVESFIGFPDTVGQQVFHAVNAAGGFDLKNASLSHQTLALFTSAYTDIMTAINVEREHLFLADCLEHLMLFVHLTALNVSSCCLGDEHEILFHISTLESLQVLLLKDNSLTDEGIRKLTAPLRINKSGPLNLKVLDLSENAEVSAKSFKFICVFRTLQFINFTGTVVQTMQQKQRDQELQQFARSFSLMIKTAPEERLLEGLIKMTRVENQGWAAGIISEWTHQFWQQRKLLQQNVASNLGTKRFYGRHSKALQSNNFNSNSSVTDWEKAFSLLLVSKQVISMCTANRSPVLLHQGASSVHRTLCDKCPAWSCHCTDASSGTKSPPPHSSPLSKISSSSSDPRLFERTSVEKRFGTCVSEIDYRSSGISTKRKKNDGTVHNLSSAKFYSHVRLTTNKYTQNQEARTSPASKCSKQRRQRGSCVSKELDDGNDPKSDDDLLLLAQYGYTHS